MLSSRCTIWRLIRPVDPTKKSTQMSSNCHDDGNSQKLDGKAIKWQDSFGRAARSEMHIPNQPYHCTRYATEHKVQQQDAFELLRFDLELPGKQAGCDDRQRRQRSHNEIVIGSSGESELLPPVPKEVKSNSNDK
jgi:hypothetical protein